MSATYELWLTTDVGERLALLDIAGGFNYARALNAPGEFSITIPGDFDDTLLDIDRRVEVWRAYDGGALTLMRAYLLRHLEYATDAAGRDTIVLAGPDFYDLARRRTIAYEGDTAYTDKADTADNLMKAFVRENLGSTATVAARRLNASYFTVEVDLGLGPSIEINGVSRRVLLDVLREIAETARTAGTRIYFDFESDTPSTIQFRTYKTLRGMDHTFPNGQPPVLLGVEFGNLADPKLTIDWRDEANYIYAGGAGDDIDREIVEVSDSDQSGKSIWARSEGFADASQADETNDITSAGRAELARRRPKLSFTGRIVDSEGTKYGRDWGFGDRLSSVDRGRQYDGIVKAVAVRVNGDGYEDIDARIETDE